MPNDILISGTARPLFRYVSGGNTYRCVMNDKPSMIELPTPFPNEFGLNRGIFNPFTLWKHSKGYRPVCAVTWDILDRPSIEKLLTILQQSQFYMRPHLNFYKEYEMICINADSLIRVGTVSQPYKGTLLFTGAENITSHFISAGSFSFNGSTKIEPDMWLGETGDISLEFWIKTPETISGAKTIFESVTAPVWKISLEIPDVTPLLIFKTGAASYLFSTQTILPNQWYFLQIRRVNTSVKYLCINGVCVSNDDLGAANNMSYFKLGDTTNGFNGLMQIFRLYKGNYGDTYYSKHSIEALDPTAFSNLKIWYDFSQGNTNCLISGANNGIVSGTAQYQKESFPDNGQKYLT